MIFDFSTLRRPPSETVSFFVAVILFAATALAVPPSAHKRDIFLSLDKFSSQDIEVARIAGADDSRDALDEVLLTEDFETVAPGALPANWMQVDRDGGYCSWFQALSRWRVFRHDYFAAHSGRKFVMCHFNDGTLPNDDWLILSENSAGAPILLSYWAASQDADYLESFEVRASTGGAAPEDFTTLVYSAASVPAAWTYFEHDLSALAGGSFRVAFHYTSTDRFVLKIDDVRIEGTPQSVGWISGTVMNDSAQAVAGATVTIAVLNRSVRTDSLGNYFLPLIPAGNHGLNFKHKYHFDHLESAVAVGAGETTRVDVTLPKMLLAFREYRSGELPRAITDFDTVSAQLFTSDTSIIHDLDVMVSIAHPRIGDLELWFVTVDTTRVQLTLRDPYVTGANITGCRFDDNAAYPWTVGDPPYSGRWRPHELLAAADGDSTLLIRGAQRFRAFKLFVYDGAEWDEGSITEFRMYLASKVGLVRGTVTDASSGQPLSAVAVRVYNSRRTVDTLTSVEGTYAVGLLPPGLFSVRFEYERYEPLTRLINVPGGFPTQLDVTLSPIVSAETPLTPLAFHFNGCTPNPFNAETRFQFTLPRAGNVSLTLYNLLGQVVARVSDGFFEAGTHDVSFRPTSLASGIYIAVLVTENHQARSKVVLLK
ncbi:carboxypeptidase regulatory-like domain-containing protein [bacterium]|nr:carboxypeptidase regulatory-like domain-containing protein [bacterium]MBU1984672.1 carboxypeptidase regulatory-like domain-containing protein [bacterium]